jgi:hypothetical protein
MASNPTRLLPGKVLWCSLEILKLTGDNFVSLEVCIVAREVLVQKQTCKFLVTSGIFMEYKSNPVLIGHPLKSAAFYTKNVSFEGFIIPQRFNKIE